MNFFLFNQIPAENVFFSIATNVTNTCVTFMFRNKSNGCVFSHLNENTMAESQDNWSCFLYFKLN